MTPANDSTKVRPRTGRNLAAGLGLGLILALVIVGIIEALDTRVRRSEEVGEVLGLPLLSRIPTPHRNQKGRLAMIDDDDQHYSEAYRKLRVNLDFANIRQAAKKILVTSALEQEGKSTTVANLAVAMARAGRHVVLVDLDLRAPSLHTFFGLGGSAGLTEIALDHVHLEDALYHVPIVGASGRLDVVPVGSIPPRPADFLESPAIDAVLSELEERADVVLIDSAPLLAGERLDSAVLEGRCAGGGRRSRAQAKRHGRAAARSGRMPGPLPWLRADRCRTRDRRLLRRLRSLRRWRRTSGAGGKRQSPSGQRRRGRPGIAQHCDAAWALSTPNRASARAG